MMERKLLCHLRRVSKCHRIFATSTQHCHLMQASRCLSTINRQPSEQHSYDVVIIGGGIVGAATAREMQTRYPMLKCAIIEKEDGFAEHQSGRSSGVIHAGIYYAPGSLMAKLCVDGLHRMYKFCQQHDVAHDRCGKLIVATETEELERLAGLYERAKINNVPDVRMVEKNEIKDIEPHCQGLRAIHSPHTGIVDYHGVTNTLVRLFKEDGGFSYTNFKVTSFNPVDSSSNSAVHIHGKNKDVVVKARYVITCGGLYADKLAVMSGCNPLPKIVPFRGDYLVLKEEKRHLVKGNIYPVPNPKFPFLGVHFTPRTDGEMWLGPNAILAFKREGYGLFDFNLKEFAEASFYRGLQKLVFKNFGHVVNELYNGFNLTATVKNLQKFIPEITPKDVVRTLDIKSVI
ncbi:L-2-hydroxyglutarate dehydrogenase, mitochondrial-like isoform X2 [Watersipora subatra]|uniref:L-2-hydroxyglutarate dehydrogenase, mitochondrial-like isoform X2 n=1 Tax=Watersipora subatra TaxID=2589382 RepID=UPI00355C9757